MIKQVVYIRIKYLRYLIRIPHSTVTISILYDIKWTQICQIFFTLFSFSQYLISKTIQFIQTSFDKLSQKNISNWFITICMKVISFTIIFRSGLKQTNFLIHSLSG